MMPSLCGGCGDESYSGTADGNPIDSKRPRLAKLRGSILEVRDVHVQKIFKSKSQKVRCRQLGRYSGSTFKAEIRFHVLAVHWVA